MAADINLHGPLTAEAKKIYSQDGTFFTCVKIKERNEVDAYGGLTIYCGSSDGAQAIADAINAAWPETVTAAEAA